MGAHITTDHNPEHLSWPAPRCKAPDPGSIRMVCGRLPNHGGDHRHIWTEANEGTGVWRRVTVEWPADTTWDRAHRGLGEINEGSE